MGSSGQIGGGMRASTGSGEPGTADGAIDRQAGDREPKPSSAATDAALAIWAERGVKNRYPIVGTSMVPVLQDGDIALVEHGTRRIRVGTIILYRNGQALTAHRVLRRVRRPGGDTFYAKGDNAPQIDQVPVAAVIGRVLGIERRRSHLRLDTPLWGVLGRLVALAGRRLPAVRRSPSPAERRPADNKTGGITRRLASLQLRLVAVVLRVALVIGGRWRRGSIPERMEGKASE